MDRVCEASVGKIWNPEIRRRTKVTDTKNEVARFNWWADSALHRINDPWNKVLKYRQNSVLNIAEYISYKGSKTLGWRWGDGVCGSDHAKVKGS